MHVYYLFTHNYDKNDKLNQKVDMQLLMKFKATMCTTTPNGNILNDIVADRNATGTVSFFCKQKRTLVRLCLTVVLHPTSQLVSKILKLRIMAKTTKIPRL